MGLTVNEDKTKVKDILSSMVKYSNPLSINGYYFKKLSILIPSDDEKRRKTETKSGEAGEQDSINETKVHCGLIRDEDLNKTLEKFWKVEDVEKPIVKNKERLICEEHYANTHFRTKEGKYVVCMPLKKEPSCLGNSKDIALKRLGSLWNRLARDENYLNLYREFLRDYERLGHMKEVTNETEPEVTYYATRQGIYRPEKSTTKLRVVFNCSSLTDNGISLNDIQYNKGVIQEDLYAQMLKFRTYTYAFTADIKMMYRTILINPKQRNLQRIVWCESEQESPKIYELSTVTYGSVSAPYLAQRTLTQLSMDEEANFPIAASVLRNNLYMDDVLCGAAKAFGDEPVAGVAKWSRYQIMVGMPRVRAQCHKDPPCRGAMHVKSVESSNLLRWGSMVVRREGPAQVSPSSLDHASKLRGPSPKALV
ncbi:uncharacterized protein TNCV_550781 [Trichonephila clavipes]|nr:uncharacterized protein TNCV_550781 [Trichonephila clavipes]